MHLSHPIQRIGLIMLFLILVLVQKSFTQSLLLIKSDAIVYDTYKEEKIMKLRLKNEMWVNYKGKHGDFIKISNYFGKDQEYPIGIFDGYVSIYSVLDTATREDYYQLQLADAPSIEIIDTPAPAKKSSSADIGKFYIGMLKSDALALSTSSFTLGKNRYGIDLSFSEQDLLSTLMLTGKPEDALAVDSSIKQQVDELKAMLRRKYGIPIKSNTYPSFLEIEIDKIFDVAMWILPGKSVRLGVGEKNDLYYAVVAIIKN